MTADIYHRLRALWTRAEEVAALRAAGNGNQRELATAIVCRNDTLLSVELAFVALQNENKRLKALVEKLDKEAGR